MQFPIAGGNDVSADLIFPVLRLQALIGLHPNAEPFLGVNFAPALITPAARRVALVLWALGDRAKIRHIE